MGSLRTVFGHGVPFVRQWGPGIAVHGVSRWCEPELLRGAMLGQRDRALCGERFVLPAKHSFRLLRKTSGLTPFARACMASGNKPFNLDEYLRRRGM